MTSEPIYNVRPVKDLKDMLEQSERLFGNKDAFLLKNADGTYRGIKYSEFKKDVDTLGTALIELGLKGKLVAIIGENRYEWCVTYLSVVNGTGVIVPLDKELPLAEIENLLTRSGASAIIFSGKYEDKFRSIYQKLPNVKYFINMDAEQDKDFFLSYKLLLEKGQSLLNKGSRLFLDSKINAESMSMLLFTSGTTDLAKGVMLSHKNICSNILATCSVLYIDSSDSVLSILPLHHTYECTNGFLLMIYNGCCIAFNEGLKHISKNLKETRPTILMLVPLIVENMYKKIWDQAEKDKNTKFKLKAALFVSRLLFDHLKIDIRKKLFKRIHENIGGRIRLIISGAAAINPDVSKGFNAMGIRLIQGYGLTEFSPIVTVNNDKAHRDDSIGIPLPGVHVSIDNPDKDGIGEIIAKGDSLMLGYFENKLATRLIIKDGWFYTGDLGRVDNNGFLYVTGRKKNVIVTKNGKNIFPEEVEAYLNKSPYIMESLVWGKLDKETGETLVNAQIVPDYEAIKEKLKIDDISHDVSYRIINNEVKNTNQNMPLYKRISGFTIRDEEFAKTTTKKIKRYVEKTG